MGEKLLHGFGVPFDELVARLLELFEYSFEIIHSRHQLEITSIVGTSYLPKASDTLVTCSRSFETSCPYSMSYLERRASRKSITPFSTLS